MFRFWTRGSRGDLEQRMLALEVRCTHLEERFSDFVRKAALRAARAGKEGALMEQLLTAAQGPAQPSESELLKRAFPGS